MSPWGQTSSYGFSEPVYTDSPYYMYSTPNNTETNTGQRQREASTSPSEALPDAGLVRQYKGNSSTAMKLRRDMADLQHQSYREKKAGRPGRGDEISKIKREIIKEEASELRHRSTACNQVHERGGIVDPGHEYASQHNLNKPRPVAKHSSRQTERAPRQNTSHNFRPAKYRQSKEFTRNRADVASSKRLGVDGEVNWAPPVLGYEKAGGAHGRSRPMQMRKIESKSRIDGDEQGSEAWGYD